MERKLLGLLAAPVNYGAGHDVTHMFTASSFFQSRRFRKVNPRSPGGFQQPRTQVVASNGAAKTLRRLLMREVGQEPAEQEPAKQEPAEQEQAKKQLITREPLRAYQYTEQAYLTARTRRVAQYFPRALGLDDFLNRLEIALFAYGFTGENCIGKHNGFFLHSKRLCGRSAHCCAALHQSPCVVLPAAMSNLCRDEITASLKQRLDNVFGSSFNTNGLGGVLTCGVTGVKAGLSHSPISEVTYALPLLACILICSLLHADAMMGISRWDAAIACSKSVAPAV